MEKIEAKNLRDIDHCVLCTRGKNPNHYVCKMCFYGKKIAPSWEDAEKKGMDFEAWINKYAIVNEKKEPRITIHALIWRGELLYMYYTSGLDKVEGMFFPDVAGFREVECEEGRTNTGNGEMCQSNV